MFLFVVCTELDLPNKTLIISTILWSSRIKLMGTTLHNLPSELQCYFTCNSTNFINSWHNHLAYHHQHSISKINKPKSKATTFTINCITLLWIVNPIVNGVQFFSLSLLSCGLTLTLINMMCYFEIILKYFRWWRGFWCK